MHVTCVDHKLERNNVSVTITSTNEQDRVEKNHLLLKSRNLENESTRSLLEKLDSNESHDQDFVTHNSKPLKTVKILL